MFTWFSPPCDISANSPASRYSSLSNSWISSELPFYRNSPADRSILVSISCFDFARPIIKSLNSLFYRSPFVLFNWISKFFIGFSLSFERWLITFPSSNSATLFFLPTFPFLLPDFPGFSLNWRVLNFAQFPRVVLPHRTVRNSILYSKKRILGPFPPFLTSPFWNGPFYFHSLFLWQRNFANS